MGEVPRRNQAEALAPRPQIQVRKIEIAAGRAGIFGMNVQIRYVHIIIPCSFRLSCCANGSIIHRKPGGCNRASLLFSRREGQKNGHFRAHSRVAAGQNFPTMPLDNILRYGKAQAIAALPLRAASVR